MENKKGLLKVNFRLRKSKKDDSGGVVYCRIILNGERAPDFSTKVKAQEKEIIKKPFQIVGSQVNNEILKQIKKRIEQIYEKTILNKQKITANQLKSKFIELNQEPKPKKSVLLTQILDDYFDLYILPQKEYNFTEATASHYSARRNKLKEILKKEGLSNLNASDFKKPLLSTIILKLQKQKLNTQYVNLCVVYLKKAIKWGIENEKIERNALPDFHLWLKSDLKVRKEKEILALETKHIELLYALNFNENENITNLNNTNNTDKKNKKEINEIDFNKITDEINEIHFVNNENIILKIPTTQIKKSVKKFITEIYTQNESAFHQSYNTIQTENINPSYETLPKPKFEVLKMNGKKALDNILLKKVGSLKNVSYLEKVRDMMFFQMFTGFDFTDVFNFDVHKNLKVFNNTLFIKKIREKRGIHKDGMCQLFPVCSVVYYLLLKYKGSPITGKEKKCYTNYLSHVKLLGEKIGFKPVLKTKTLRKTFTMQRLREGMSIEVIAKMVGHNDIATTQKYYTEIETERIIQEVKTKKTPY